MKIASSKIVLQRLSILCLVFAGLLLVTVLLEAYCLRELAAGTLIVTDVRLIESLLYSAAICLLALLVCTVLRRYVDATCREHEAQTRAGERANAQAIAASRRAEQLAGLTHHLMRVSEDEKSKLATELHGGLAACFTVLTMDMSVIAAQLRNTDAAVAARMERIVAVVRDALDLERRLVENLRPSMLEALGLPLVLGVCVKEFARNASLRLNLDISEDVGKLSYECSIGLFRITQLALKNIVQHAHATTIFVSLYNDADVVILSIGDDGKGFDCNVPDSPDAFGLIEIRERVTRLGGEFIVKTGDEQIKTIIEVRIPVRPAIAQ